MTDDNWFSSVDGIIERVKRNLPYFGTLRRYKSTVLNLFLPNIGRPVASTDYGFRKDI